MIAEFAQKQVMSRKNTTEMDEEEQGTKCL